MPASKSKVTAIQHANTRWSWHWTSPNGTPHFAGGFPTKKAALGAGRKFEKRATSALPVEDNDGGNGE